MSASPPLDLEAIEARLMQKIRHRSDEVLTIGCDTARDIEALLAYARARPDCWGLLDEACSALRDVFTDVLHWDVAHLRDYNGSGRLPAVERAAVVLDRVRRRHHD